MKQCKHKTIGGVCDYYRSPCGFVPGIEENCSFYEY